MNVTQLPLPELKLVGFEVKGPRSELAQHVPNAWKKLVEQLERIPNRKEPHVFYGAFPESDHASAGDNEHYTYVVAVEVSEPPSNSLPDGMRALTIPAARYATTRIHGTAEAIDAAYIGLSRWLHAQAMQSDSNAWSFEHFDYDIFKPLKVR